MRFTRPNRRPKAEAIVPMINVVFLLLIFFMMSARIAPPPPFDMTLPATTRSDALPDHATLYVSHDGQLAFQDARGDAVWAAVQATTFEDNVTIRADGAFGAKDMAQILRQLAAVGITDVTLAVAQ